MAERKKSQSVERIAIVILVLCVIGLLIYFLGFRSRTTIVDKPDINEKPNTPGPDEAL